MQQKKFLFTACLSLFLSVAVFADDPPKTPEDLARDAAIAAFTKKMEQANYPALFEKAAREFNVPVEILEGVSFAETRWEHLTWPEGETVSPENGMPRPYGIMSLWDNEFFGHSLIEAAALIGKTPDDLKRDPLDNMRGAAALLRQIYDKAPKPNGVAESDLESWRYAIAEYCGIPEPDLKHQHAFDVYEHLSEGYDQYGIKLPKVSGLKLDEMYAEVKKIKDEEQKKREAKYSDEDREAAGLGPVIRDEPPVAANSSSAIRSETNRLADKTPAKEPQTFLPVAAAAPQSASWRGIAILGAVALVVIFLFIRKRPLPKKPK